MATFETDGLSDLILSLEEIAEMPDSVMEDMLMAGGEIIKQGQKESIQSLGLVDSGRLRDSIQAVPKFQSRKKRHVLVYPQGTHHVSKNGLETRNAEVGFIHEFGAQGAGIEASQWMRAANEKHIDRAVDAEADVYDKFLKSKNL